MKAHVLLLFVASLIAVGYVTRVATEDEPTTQDRRGGPRGRFPSSGPFFHNVENFADELKLTEAQRQQLQQMVDETTSEVRRREREIRSYVYATRDRVDELLTDAQKEQLKALNEKKWQEYRARRVQRAVSRLEETAGVDAGMRERVATVLTEYEDAKADLYRNRDRRDPNTDRDARREQSRVLRETRDRRLAEILPADVIETFVTSLDSWKDRRNGRHRDGVKRGDGNGKRDGRRGPRGDKPGGRP